MNIFGYSKLLRGCLREGTTWGFVVRGFHEGLVWGFFERVFTYYPAWPTKYHNRQIRQGHAAYAVRNRILDGFSYYDKELIKEDNGKGLVISTSPSNLPLTKNPQQLCYFLCQTLTKDPQQVWQTLKNFDYPDQLREQQYLATLSVYDFINPPLSYKESLAPVLIAYHW